MRLRFHDQPLFTAVLLLAVSLLAYGWMIVHPGFFGDDVTLLWLHQRGGLSALNEFYGNPGQGSAVLVSGLIAAFGQEAWKYHLTAILFRWLGAWSFWLLISNIWPERRLKALLAGLIFLVFPGLKHTPLPITILPHLLALCLVAAGFFLIHQGVLQPKRRFAHFIAAWLTGAGSLLSSYFIGLEILRIALIWKDWGRKEGIHIRERLVKTALTWAPFAFFLAVRFWMGIPGGKSGPVELGLTGFAVLAKTALRDLAEMAVLAWRQIFQIPQAREVLFPFFLIIFIAGLISYLGFLRPDQGTERKTAGGADEKKENGGFLATGLAALIAGGAPLWAAGVAAGLNYPDSITALAFLPGTALLMAGLIDLLLLPRFQPALASLLIALAVGAQVLNSAGFSKDWQTAEALIIQFHNRAPGLKEGTILISEQVPLDYYSAENLSAFFNLAYFSTRQGERDGLVYLDAFTVLDTAQSGGAVEINVNGFHFAGSLDHGLVFYQPGGGCLRVLENGAGDPSGLPHTLGQLIETLGANFDAVIPGQKAALPEMIAAKAAPQRCVILEQIELANQSGDHRQAGNLLGDHFEELVQVDEPYELAPLAAAAGYSGRADLLNEVVRESTGADGSPFEVCSVLDRLEADESLDPKVKQALEELKDVTFCQNYD